MENDLHYKISYKAKLGRKTKTSGSNVLITKDNTKHDSLESASERAKSSSTKEAKCTWELGKCLGLFSSNYVVTALAIFIWKKRMERSELV